MATRGAMVGLGVAAGAGHYLLFRLAETEALTGRGLLAVGVLLIVFFSGLLAMTGPLKPARAALGAAGIAIGVTALLLLVSLRFVTVEGIFDSPHPTLAAIVLATVPMPFWIAANRTSWRDYPMLFGESWGIVVRYAAAWAFVGVVWAVIWLSHALLSIVGIDLIQWLIDVGPVPWLITGGTLGLALAVVQELSDYVSPYLLLRLLRLLLPVVLLVTVVFLVALPLRGFSGLFGGLSVALTLLAMAGAAATLVTTAVDQEDLTATDSPVLTWGARAMALLLPVLAGLGAWAVWLRVDQHGWTPDRLFAAEVAVLGLGYGVAYALAVLRGKGWMARIRQANIGMAVALMVVAALGLTPLLNAERMSTASVMARLDDGRMPVEQLEPSLLSRWGTAGAAALATLEARAKEPGQEALAARLADPFLAPATGEDTEALRAELVALLPLQPATATATRDAVLAGFQTYQLRSVLDACRQTMPGGGPGCVMVVAELLTQEPGEEAVIATRFGDGYVSVEGYVQGGNVAMSTRLLGVAYPQGEEGIALLRSWQTAPPAVQPAPLNQLVMPQGGVILVP